MRVLILLDNGFEDAEVIYPLYRLREEGCQVDILSAQARRTYRGKHGVPFDSDVAPEDVNIDSYDVIIIPGGEAPDKMRSDQGLVRLVKKAYAKGKVIAAIGHGPQMLIEADVLRGRKTTGWPSVQTDMKNAGAEVSDEPVVVDGRIVTAKSSESLTDFCREIIKLLKK